MPPRRPLSFWAGVALGLAASPLLVLLLARTVTALYHGLDGDGRYGLAVAGVRELGAALDRHRGRHHRMPSARDGLAKLAPEFVAWVPTDPWGTPYVYEPSGPDWADVISYGADRKPAGNGANTDVSARYGRLGPRPPSWLRALATLLLVGVPLAAALAAERPWCAGVLAGGSAFWGALLTAMVGGSVQTLFAPLSFAAGAAGMVGALAVTWDLPYARIVAFLAVAAAYGLVLHLVST